MNSRKLPAHFDCPVDNVLLTIVEKCNPYFYKLKLSPNDLTSISTIFGSLACVFCCLNYYILGAFFHFIGYFFDCADGNFARTYNMVTTFGDIYDHVKDITVGLLLMRTLIIKGVRIYFAPFVVLLYFNNLFLAKQEEYFQGQKSEILKRITFKSNYSLGYLRYFGCGVLNLYISTMLVFIGVTGLIY